MMRTRTASSVIIEQVEAVNGPLPRSDRPNPEQERREDLQQKAQKLKREEELARERAMLVPIVRAQLTQLTQLLDAHGWPGASRRKLRWLSKPLACIEVSEHSLSAHKYYWTEDHKLYCKYDMGHSVCHLGSLCPSELRNLEYGLRGLIKGLQSME